VESSGFGAGAGGITGISTRTSTGVTGAGISTATVACPGAGTEGGAAAALAGASIVSFTGAVAGAGGASSIGLIEPLVPSFFFATAPLGARPLYVLLAISRFLHAPIRPSRNGLWRVIIRAPR
jgi:hypothetical protein